MLDDLEFIESVRRRLAEAFRIEALAPRREGQLAAREIVRIGTLRMERLRDRLGLR